MEYWLYSALLIVAVKFQNRIVRFAFASCSQAAMPVGNRIDTAVFFSVAFWRSSNAFMVEHWIEITFVDYLIKIAVSILLFVPLYGVLLAAL